MSDAKTWEKIIEALPAMAKIGLEKSDKIRHVGQDLFTDTFHRMGVELANPGILNVTKKDHSAHLAIINAVGKQLPHLIEMPQRLAYAAHRMHGFTMSTGLWEFTQKKRNELAHTVFEIVSPYIPTMIAADKIATCGTCLTEKFASVHGATITGKPGALEVVTVKSFLDGRDADRVPLKAWLEQEASESEKGEVTLLAAAFSDVLLGKATPAQAAVQLKRSGMDVMTLAA